MMKRVEILFSAEQLSQLRRIAKLRGCSVAELVRQAVERQLLSGEREARLRLVEQLAGMSLPVADWETMERESVEGE